MTDAKVTEDDRSGLRAVHSPQAIAWAEKECAPALKIVRLSYRPSQHVEDMLIAAFLHGAACAFKMDSDLGDVEPRESFNAG